MQNSLNCLKKFHFSFPTLSHNFLKYFCKFTLILTYSAEEIIPNLESRGVLFENVGEILKKFLVNFA